MSSPRGISVSSTMRPTRTSAEQRAIVEIFRLLPDGRIDEHSDVIQPLPRTSANPNGMF